MGHAKIAVECAHVRQYNLGADEIVLVRAVDVAREAGAEELEVGEQLGAVPNALAGLHLGLSGVLQHTHIELKLCTRFMGYRCRSQECIIFVCLER